MDLGNNDLENNSERPDDPPRLLASVVAEGQLFESMVVAKKTIKDYCMQEQLPYYVVQSGPNRLHLACRFTKRDKNTGEESPIECAFTIKAFVQKKLGHQVRINQSNVTHTCGCMLWSTNNAPISSTWIGEHSSGLMQDVPRVVARNIQNHVKRKLGAHVNIKTVHKAKSNHKRLTREQDALAFQLIQPYFDKIKRTNPGSIAVLQRDSMRRLLRTFVMLKPIVQGFRFCLPVLSLDACHLRGTYKGVLMAATIVDAQRHTQLLAWGTAPIENASHWNWFCWHLKRGLDVDFEEMCQEEEEGGNFARPVEPRVLSIISDREKGIALALQDNFPSCSHFFCLFHIEKNIRNNCGTLKETTRNLFYQAAKSNAIVEFERTMLKIQSESPRVFAYLLTIPYDKWATSHAPVRKWGMTTSNVSESMNHWMEDVRNGSHINLHITLVTMVMQRQYKRREEVDKCTSYFPPGLYALLNERQRLGRKYTTYPASPTLFQVGVHPHNRMNDKEVVITLRNPQCPCLEWQQTGLPCTHLAAAILCSGSRPTPNTDNESLTIGAGRLMGGELVGSTLGDYVDPYYKAETLRGVYAPVVIPCAAGNDLEPDGVTLPQLVLTQAGRPKMKRFRSAADDRHKDVAPPEENRPRPVSGRTTCHNCLRVGHNARSCPMAARGGGQENFVYEDVDEEGVLHDYVVEGEEEDTDGNNEGDQEETEDVEPGDSQEEDEAEEEQGHSVAFQEEENRVSNRARGNTSRVHRKDDDYSSSSSSVNSLWNTSPTKNRKKWKSSSTPEPQQYDSSSSSSEDSSVLSPPRPPRQHIVLEEEGLFSKNVYKTRGKNKGKQKYKKPRNPLTKIGRPTKEKENIDHSWRNRNADIVGEPVEATTAKRKRVQKGPRKCGYCEGTGHNSRGCPKKKLDDKQRDPLNEVHQCDNGVVETIRNDPTRDPVPQVTQGRTQEEQE